MSSQLCSLAGELDEVVTVQKGVALTVRPFVNSARSMELNTALILRGGGMCFRDGLNRKL